MELKQNWSRSDFVDSLALSKEWRRGWNRKNGGADSREEARMGITLLKEKRLYFKKNKQKMMEFSSEANSVDVLGIVGRVDESGQYA